MRPLKRAQPLMPAANYKTYGAAQPLATHFRPGTCAEAECDAHRLGWTTTVDETTELGQQQAHYIRKDSGRAFKESRNEAGLTVFDFPAGQTCFRPHHIPLEREAVFYVAGGDWRGNPRGIETYKHKRAEDWVSDFAEHQQALADRAQQG